tara:strand:- start:3419 stop:5350 length:1932 start_codon:yes stop_codon:yes gene_type:complete
MRPIINNDPSGNTHITQFNIDGNDVLSIAEYAYGSRNGLEQFNHRQPSEDDIQAVQECYTCSEDPRLPDDVKEMPVGKREDFVEIFNKCFWHYRKDQDEGYDEEMAEGSNRCRYSMEKAYEGCGMEHGGEDEDPDEKDMEAGFYDDYSMAESPDSIEEAEGNTDFPKKGDNQKITLSNSKYPQFPYAYAAKLKEEYPSIWKRGGNIYGNTAYQNWTKARKGEDTPGVRAWIKKREAWAARHFKNKRPAGVVALIKWGVVGNIGVSGMKKVLKPLMDREKKKKREGAIEEFASGDNVIRLTETFVGGIPFESFKESKTGYTNEITVIERGWSLNGNYYGDTALAEIAKQANNYVVGYFNHGETFNRDPRDWAIVTESGRYDSGKVKSRIHIFKNPDGAFLEERINYAKRKKANHLFGVSIDAFAQVTEGEAEGRDGVIVEKILKLNSVDIVMVPAAKGGFNANESIAESTFDIQKERLMDINTLREEHPDTAQLLIEEGRKLAADSHEEAVQEKDGYIATLTEKVADLEEELAKASAKVDEYEQAEKQVVFESKVRDLIEEGLDESKRSDRFESILISLGEENIDTIKEMIADRQESAVAAVVTGEGVGSSVVEAKEEEPAEEAEVVESTQTDRLAAFKANLKG